MQIPVLTTLLILLTGAQCMNFPYESVQLTDKDIVNFPAIAYGDKSSSTNHDGASCKATPGSPEWPADDEWNQLNSSLGGALLKPVPAASVCYSGSSALAQDAAACNFLLRNVSTTRFYINDPLNVLTAWPEGDTCFATANPQGNCTQGGFPTYVVNASTVQQIQMGVNFARNKNIRLIIKNTGHDWVGRSVGAGSLSIWTHYFKDFEYLPQYSQGDYSGRAARVGAGLESWELYPLMDANDMALVAPAGGSTIGVYGGFTQGGGHSVMASYYGLGADQVLSLQVVTADGRFVTADPEKNQDLFYALRGGGPATYGIVTSAVVKAYPRTVVNTASLSFLLGNFSFGPPPPPNSTIPAPVVANSSETFWQGVSMFYFYGKHITELGGTTFNYVTQISNTTYSFSTTFQMPGMSPEQVYDAVQPLYDSLNDIGIKVPAVNPVPSVLWAPSPNGGAGDVPGNSLFSSRLFPRVNWDHETLWNATMAAVRETVEAGYAFHGIHMAPTEKVAGYPGNNAVNPAFRNGLMHADSYDTLVVRGASPQKFKDAYARHNSYMDKIRAVTPTGGAYINEADVTEPNWQQSFFGDNYPRLLKIKKATDPWGVFWAPSTPGSEAWEVKTADGLPTQNGPLCKTGQ